MYWRRPATYRLPPTYSSGRMAMSPPSMLARNSTANATVATRGRELMATWEDVLNRAHLPLYDMGECHDSCRTPDVGHCATRACHGCPKCIQDRNSLPCNNGESGYKVCSDWCRSGNTSIVERALYPVVLLRTLPRHHPSQLLRPLLPTLRRRLDSLEAHRGLGSSPQAAPKMASFLLPPGTAIAATVLARRATSAGRAKATESR